MNKRDRDEALEAVSEIGCGCMGCLGTIAAALVAAGIAKSLWLLTYLSYLP